METRIDHPPIELAEQDPPPSARRPSARWTRPASFGLAGLLALFLLVGLPSGKKPDLTAEQAASLHAAVEQQGDRPDLVAQTLPPQGYQLPASYGDLGPRLLATGAIDYEGFVRLYEQSGRPLTQAQRAILTEGSSAPIVIDRANAHFLLNLFWAFGLTNRNPVLEGGPMIAYSQGDIGGFASTGGWTLGRRPATALYSSVSILTMTEDQQARLERVAAAVYRPCCNNPTDFPDCNHGMAMLGLLEVMAAQGATEEAMFEAAKYVNAFWFPQQALELATFFWAAQGQTYSEVDPRVAVGPEYFSAEGFRRVHAVLVQNGLLDQAPQQGGGCGV